MNNTLIVIIAALFALYLIFRQFTEQEIIDIVIFYFSVVKPLARICTNWAIGNLALETNSKQDDEPFSKTEETRLLRALYRFQLCCNLFGVNHETSKGIGYNIFSHHDILGIFFNIFEPWEIEEIISINAFAERKYNDILVQIECDLLRDYPKFTDEGSQSDGWFDMSSIC